MASTKLKKNLLLSLPGIMFAFVGNIVSFSARNTTGHDVSD